MLKYIDPLAAARRRIGVAANEPVHASDTDRRQQRADRRRDHRLQLYRRLLESTLVGG
jgi:hypothetical protein